MILLPEDFETTPCASSIRMRKSAAHGRAHFAAGRIVLLLHISSIEPAICLCCSSGIDIPFHASHCSRNWRHAMHLQAVFPNHVSVAESRVTGVVGCRSEADGMSCASRRRILAQQLRPSPCSTAAPRLWWWRTTLCRLCFSPHQPMPRRQFRHAWQRLRRPDR